MSNAMDSVTLENGVKFEVFANLCNANRANESPCTNRDFAIRCGLFHVFRGGVRYPNDASRLLFSFPEQQTHLKTLNIRIPNRFMISNSRNQHFCKYLSIFLNLPEPCYAEIVEKLHDVARSIPSEDNDGDSTNIISIDLQICAVRTRVYEYQEYLSMIESKQPEPIPASKEAIDALDRRVYGGVQGSMEQSLCTICLERFEPGLRVTQMPCNHIFHEDCIVEWLKKSHLCPLCRFLRLIYIKNVNCILD